MAMLDVVFGGKLGKGYIRTVYYLTNFLGLKLR